MSQQTNIAWATSTGSPWFGCTEVSPGCKNCYARELTLKRKWADWGNANPRVRSKGFWSMARRLDARSKRVQEFCDEQPKPRMFPSLMDWLDPKAPVELLAEFLELIRTTPNLDWLLLTKRPKLFRRRLADMGEAYLPETDYGGWIGQWEQGIFPPNVWIGVSVEDQQRADERIPELLKIPAKVRFLSCEPLLDRIVFDYTVKGSVTSDWSAKGLRGIDWVIVGGESGPGRRDCGVDAIVDVVRQCQAAGVPCFVKQDCAARPGQQGRIPESIWAIKNFPSNLQGQ